VLEELLETISVLPPGMWENEQTATLGSWFAVCTENGIVAYFMDEADAYRFRLDQINLRLNPLTRK